MGAKHETAVRAGLLSALLASAVLLGAVLPPTFLAGGALSFQNPTPPTGLLLVNVSMSQDGGPSTPLAGVDVGISQSILHGIRLALATNGSGQVGLPLEPGQYAVTANDSRFSLETLVQVNQSATTELRVVVNRTEYLASFADAEGATTSGQVNTWNRLVVAVPPPGLIVFPFGGGAVEAIPVGQNLNSSSLPTFGKEVFVQPFVLYGGPLSPGVETPASVVSQVQRSSLTWLTLQPLETLDLGGASYLAIVSYAAGSSVSYQEGVR